MTVSNDRVALGYAGGAWDGDEAAVARVHVGEVEHHDGKVGVEPAVAAVGQVLVAVLALRGRGMRRVMMGLEFSAPLLQSLNGKRESFSGRTVSKTPNVS